MTTEISNLQSPASPAPSVPSVASVLQTRAEVEAKLLDRLDAAFGVSSLSYVIASSHNRNGYLARVVAAHLHVPEHVASDAIAASRTFADLAEKICELKGIEPSLFSSPVDPSLNIAH